MKKFALLAAFFAVLSLFAAPVFAGEKDEEATYKKIENALESTSLDSLSYEKQDINEVVKDLAKKGNISILIDKEALKDIKEEDRKVTVTLGKIKLGNALNIVIQDVGLYKSYKNGVLYLTTKEKAQGATSNKIYDVRDITAAVQDFPAPKIRMKESDDSSGVGVEMPPEEKETPTTDDIVDMIKETIEADWDTTCTVTIVKGQLIVKATREVHKQVADLLDQLRTSK
ncbi:MAG: hypothetical protein IT462_01885 [Planctomycetes bacterium]|nr:hypothetical protein [Planctomycetota bacterium]